MFPVYRILNVFASPATGRMFDLRVGRFLIVENKKLLHMQFTTNSSSLTAAARNQSAASSRCDLTAEAVLTSSPKCSFTQRQTFLQHRVDSQLTAEPQSSSRWPIGWKSHDLCRIPSSHTHTRFHNDASCWSRGSERGEKSGFRRKLALLMMNDWLIPSCNFWCASNAD